MTDERMRAMWKISDEIDAIADLAADLAINELHADDGVDELFAMMALTQTLIDVYTSKEREQTIGTLITEMKRETLRRIHFKLKTPAQEPS